MKAIVKNYLLSARVSEEVTQSDGLVGYHNSGGQEELLISATDEDGRKLELFISTPSGVDRIKPFDEDFSLQDCDLEVKIVFPNSVFDFKQ